MPVADIALGYDGERLVQITITTTSDDEDGQLGYDELLYAARQIQDLARREYRVPLAQRSRIGVEAVQQMVDAYTKANGRITDDYLARLALAYAQLAPRRRDVSTALADALDKPVPTVKGHIMRARREGFLTEAVDGKEGGEATPKTREVIANT